MSDSETCKGTTPEGGHAQSSRAYSEHFQSTFQDWTLTHGLQSERFLSISRAKVIDTGESTSALGRVRAAVAGAVELGLKKKAAILALRHRTLPAHLHFATPNGHCDALRPR